VIARLRRLRSIGPSGIALLCGAFVTLIRIRIALWVLPWNRITGAAVATLNSQSGRPAVDRLEWAVLAASRFVPRATCLTQALALRRLLSRSGYQSSVQIGVRLTDGRFAAHAWVEHESKSLLSNGGDVMQYVRFFSWPPSQPDLP
jgi:hypothetical protein